MANAEHSLVGPSLKGLKRRIAFIYALCWLLGLGSLLAVALREGQARRLERVDTELALRATIVYGMAWFDPGGEFHPEILDREPWAHDEAYPLRVLVFDDNDEPQLTYGPTLDWEAHPGLRAPTQRVLLGDEERWQGDVGDQRAYLLPLLDDDEPLIRGVALVTHHRSAVLREQLRYSGGLVAVAAALALAGLLLAWWLAQQSVRPLATMLSGRARFIARAAHELRTPLASVRSIVDSTQAGDEPAETGLKRINQLSVAASRRVDTLLWHARLQSGDSELKREPTRIDLLVDALLEDFPQAVLEAEAQTASVDVALLEVAMRNLIENAVRHAGAAAGEGLTLRVGPNFIEVQDSGPGFPPDFQIGARRFDSPEAGGVGLGLEIASAVATLHGGSLRLEPTPSGARVRLTFASE